jgi:hypothetical protein
MKNIAPVVLLAIATAGCSRMPQEEQAAKITLIAMERAIDREVGLDPLLGRGGPL